MRLRLYKVSFDRVPGGWKQGEDPYKLVIASSAEDAKQIGMKPSCGSIFKQDVMTGEYVTNWTTDRDPGVYDYTKLETQGGNISVQEIRFENFKFVSERNEKIDEILNEK